MLAMAIMLYWQDKRINNLENLERSYEIVVSGFDGELLIEEVRNDK